jgi:two-component system chemotaxis response regulator CheB
MTALPPIRVLLVDDSAVVRGALGKILEAERDIKVVTTAPNGQMALDALRHTEIDVVLLDVEMPVMDGITALPLILSAHPKTRVIMTSSLTQQGAAITMQALALGATDYISKPSARAGGSALAAVAGEIVSKVRAIGRAKKVNIDPPVFRGLHAAAPAPASIIVAATGHGGDVAPKALAIAASTGGPNALADVLSRLPADFPLPVFITQHMPPVFTALLAQRLQRDCGRPCVEATHGMPVRAGCTYVAPGDWHLLVQTVEGQPVIRLEQSPPENHCRPAADPMLRSIAAVYGAATLAVVLTGMGEDGRRGCATVRERGGRILVQDEASSVVWGMPGAVASAGLANWILPLPEIASKISSLCFVGAT